MKQLISLMPLLVAVCIAQSGAPPRQQSAHMLDATTSHPVHLSYRLFLPATYAATPDTHWPLILYLHGGSLRGENVEQLRTLGLPHKLESEPDFPFVVVSPQCPAGEIWTDAEAIDALLDRVIRDYRIDQQRIYVTDHSMGGRGALYFANRLPSRFAAVLALSPYSPVSAWGNKLAQIPLWLFQGSADTLAPITETKELVGAIQSAGGHPRFNSLEGRDHFILDVYDRPDVYQWLLQQKRNTSVAKRNQCTPAALWLPENRRFEFDKGESGVANCSIGAHPL
jgi:predicted peptidase